MAVPLMLWRGFRLRLKAVGVPFEAHHVLLTLIYILS